MGNVGEFAAVPQEAMEHDLRAMLRGAIRASLEVFLQEKLTALVGAEWYGRVGRRRDRRNGAYQRTDRWGPRRTLAVGWLVYAALAVSFAAASTAAQAWAVFLAFGLVSGLTESPERKLVAGYAGAARRGRGFGWYHGSLSAVALPGAALFGWLYQDRGAAVALYASAGATLLAVLLVGRSGVSRRRSGEQEPPPGSPRRPSPQSRLA